MLDNKTIIKVTNRDNGSVGYTIPDLGNLHRNFESGETKEITMEELRKLSYLPGGEPILKNYLVLDNQEAIHELLNEEVEPEYFYTEKEIKELITNGTLEQFEDCLDFAPAGTIDLLKDLSVKMELNDVAKRKALLEKTGFNVTSAIRINHEAQEDEEIEQEPKKTRRAAAIETPTKKVRSAEPISKYKVISKKN